MASKVGAAEDEEIVNDDLEALKSQSITNSIKFNVDKCSVMNGMGNDFSDLACLYKIKVLQIFCQWSLQYSIREAIL